MNTILVINSGSSSLKFGLFVNHNGDEHPIARGNADAIGADNGKLEIVDEQGNNVFKETQHLDSHKTAFNQIAKRLAALKQWRSMQDRRAKST